MCRRGRRDAAVFSTRVERRGLAAGASATSIVSLWSSTARPRKWNLTSSQLRLKVGDPRLVLGGLPPQVRTHQHQVGDLSVGYLVRQLVRHSGEPWFCNLPAASCAC